MLMRLLTGCLVVSGFCLASHAIAGVQYTQVSSSGAEGSNTTSEMMLEGDKFKSVFVTSDIPMMSSGLYVLATGPKQIYMVNPATHVYSRMNTRDMQKMGQDAQQMAGPGGDAMKAEYEDFKAVKELDEAGPIIVGLPTRHYQYSISYKEIRQPPGSPMKMTMNIEEVNEFWASREFGMTSPDGWQDPTQGGGESSSQSNIQLQEAERQMAEHGFVLRRVVTRKTSMGGMIAAMTMGRGGDADKRSMEITALNRNANFPPGTFDLPRGFTEVDMMNLMGGGVIPDLKSVPGKEQGQEMPDLNKEPPQ
jgi:hypothetical protein